MALLLMEELLIEQSSTMLIYLFTKRDIMRDEKHISNMQLQVDFA